MSAMSAKTRVLHVEDEITDSDLVSLWLHEAGLDWEVVRVDTRDAFLSALESDEFDIVLSDFQLPAFNGHEALTETRARRPDLAFVFFTATLGEERAVEALKAGATDFVAKERPDRLVPALLRAVREAEERMERKRLEAQLLQSQKLEAVGQLAAGVAHDFNNLLNVITGYSELLLRSLPAQGTDRERTEQIRRAADRGAGLTRQLLAFSRRQVLEPRVLDLNAALADVQSMLARLIGEHIKIVTSFDPALGHVFADPGQMEQVLVNLVVNARDAMPSGGALVLETSNADLDDNYVRTHPGSRAGTYVRLAVSDTGHGMDAATASRVFEPFFTTKPRGKGTGLGLATVHGIVQQSGGHVDVYSEPGHGTTFKIYLPRVDATDERPAEDGTAAEARGGTETIVLVEDEDGLRALIREVLEDAGYRVVEAPDPEGGLAAVRAQPKGIDLLMTDVILPQMRGNELADRVRTISPSARVLFMSGYTDEAIGHHAALTPGAQFLQKPFALSALLAKVRAVLEGPPEPPPAR